MLGNHKGCRYIEAISVGVGFPNPLGEGRSLSRSLFSRLILAPTIGTYRRIMDTPYINVNMPQDNFIFHT